MTTVPEGNRDEPAYNWLALVPLLLHPVQTAIFESLAQVGRPLSPTQLDGILEVDNAHYQGMAAYHARRLMKQGALEVVCEREARGATEKFYFFASE